MVSKLASSRAAISSVVAGSLSRTAVRRVVSSISSERLQRENQLWSLDCHLGFEYTNGLKLFVSVDRRTDIDERAESELVEGTYERAFHGRLPTTNSGDWRAMTEW